MKKNNSKLAHIYIRQLPERIQQAIVEKGFSVYRNVLVVWDSLPDKAVIDFVDSVVDDYPKGLLAVYFEDNLLEMIWKDKVPDNLQHHITETQRGRIEMDPSAYVIPVLF